MSAFGAYQYICARCREPLLSSLDNSWLRVSVRHVTATPGVELEPLPNLTISEETLNGTKELSNCEIQQVYCQSCDAKLGVKCIGASSEKRGFTGRFFLRLSSLGALGLTPILSGTGSGSGSQWRTEAISLEAHEPSLPLHLALLPDPDPEETVTNQLLNNGNNDVATAVAASSGTFVRRDELETLLQKHTAALNEALRSSEALQRDVATLNQSLRWLIDEKVSRKENAPAMDSGALLPNTSNRTPVYSQTRASNADRAIPETEDGQSLPASTLLRKPSIRAIEASHMPETTQQYLQQNVLSDDPADSDFELSDASIGRQQRSVPTLASPRAELGSPHLVLRPQVTDPLDLKFDSDFSKIAGSASELAPLNERMHRHRPAIRGRRIRRGTSGRQFSRILDRSRARAEHGPKDAVSQVTQSQLSRPDVIYRSSPLAASLSAEDETGSEGTIATVGNRSSLRFPISEHPTRQSSTDEQGSVEDMSHQRIMRLLDKGMKSNCAKSALLRGLPSHLALPN